MRGLDEFADAAGIGLGVAVAGERVGAAAGFDEDVRPDHAGFDVDGGHLGNTDADLVLAEPRTFVSNDRLVRYFDDGGKEMVAAGPAAGFESFRFHGGSVTPILFSASELGLNKPDSRQGMAKSGFDRRPGMERRSFVSAGCEFLEFGSGAVAEVFAGG